MVAQQILSILSALAGGSQRFVFEGREIKLEWSCGIFITMNPGMAVHKIPRYANDIITRKILYLGFAIIFGGVTINSYICFWQLKI